LAPFSEKAENHWCTVIISLEWCSAHWSVI